MVTLFLIYLLGWKSASVLFENVLNIQMSSLSERVSKFKYKETIKIIVIFILAFIIATVIKLQDKNLRFAVLGVLAYVVEQIIFILFKENKYK